MDQGYILGRVDIFMIYYCIFKTVLHCLISVLAYMGTATNHPLGIVIYNNHSSHGFHAIPSIVLTSWKGSMKISLSHGDAPKPHVIGTKKQLSTQKTAGSQIPRQL